jgi:hypothetical protein
MAKNDVAVKNEGAVALVSTFEQDAMGGFDGMDQEDYALPFLRLLTNTSPEVGSVEGAMPGMVYNTVTGELHDGKKGIEVVSCAYVRQYIEWAPRGSGSGAPINIYPATSDVLSRTHREPGDNKDYLDNGNYIENTANHYVMVIREDGTPMPRSYLDEVYAVKEVPQVEQHGPVREAPRSQRAVHPSDVLAALPTDHGS